MISADAGKPAIMKKIAVATAVLAALAAVIAFTRWSVIKSDRQMRTDLLMQAKLVAPMVDINFVAGLSGTERDLEVPGFVRLRDMLAHARKANPQCRFLYLLGQKSDGTVFFYLDTEPADSKDNSPPGQVYSEVSPNVLRVFSTGVADTEGPYTDRWGRWISALVPLRNERTGLVAAVLGMDVDAGIWGWEIARRSALPAGLSYLALLLAALMAVLAWHLKRVRAHERDMVASEARYRRVVGTANEGILITDIEFRITYVNERLCGITGFAPEGLIGRSVTDFLGQEGAGNPGAWEEGRKKGFKGSIERRIRGGEGRDVWVILSSSPILGEDNTFQGSFTMVTDITERKHAEEALALAMEEKNALFRELQHRVMNTLAMISSLANLEADSADNPAVHEALDSIKGRINSLSNLYSMLYTSGETREVRLDQYARAIGDSVMAAYSTESSGIGLEMKAEDISVSTKTASSLGLILNELLVNAFKYAFAGNEGGTIRVAVRRCGDDLELMVADDGKGLPGEFDPSKSTGFGLRLTWMLAKQMKGSLSFERGAGATFRLRVPLV